MSTFKSGYVTIIGLPNAGKSSLINRVVKESVSIVTAKPQTTRKRTLGILTEKDRYQVIFVDTPGLIESSAGLNTYLKSELTEAVRDVDLVVGAIAPWEFDKDELPWVLKTRQETKVGMYIYTQSDKINAESRNRHLAKWNEWCLNLNIKSDLYFTSARTAEGLLEFMSLVESNLPEGPQYYDSEIYTPQTMRELASEVVRKYCFEMLHQEIPYGLAVLMRRFEEGTLYEIESDIIVTKDSHKGMVIGSGGKTLKEIGTRARIELEKAFDRKVFLKLHVVVKPAWTKDKNWLKELGYAGQPKA